mgnify:FL=1
MSSKAKKTAKKAAKKGGKGKRYTPAEKQQVIDFVNEVNASKGRGGQSAASKKFGISPLTISSWLKAGGAAPKKKRGRKATAKPAKASGGSLEKKMKDLQSLAKKIDSTKAQLAKLQSQFDGLKGSL